MQQKRGKGGRGTKNSIQVTNLPEGISLMAFMTGYKRRPSQEPVDQRSVIKEDT